MAGREFTWGESFVNKDIESNIIISSIQPMGPPGERKDVCLHTTNIFEKIVMGTNFNPGVMTVHFGGTESFNVEC